MADGPAIALIDGEHHPAAVRVALDRLEADRGLAGVVFCGGEEKVRPGVLDDPEPTTAARCERLGRRRRRCARAGARAASVVIDLADEPVLPPRARKLELAALALHLGLAYEAPGMRLDPAALRAAWTSAGPSWR